MAVGQVVYTPWCDDDGKVIDDGTVARLADDRVRWTAADPNFRWLVAARARAARGRSKTSASRWPRWRCRGRRSARLLAAVSDLPIATLKYFRAAVRHDRRRARRGDAHRLHRRPRLRAVDAVGPRRRRCGTRSSTAGRAHALRPAGMLALDVARVEAGLLLTDVDFHSSRKASIDAQMYSPYELGLGRLVALDKASPFVGRAALRREHAAGHRRQIVGLEVRWSEVEAHLPGRGAAADRAGRRLARRGAGLQRHAAGGEGHDHRVVADAEAADRAGHHRPPALRRRAPSCGWRSRSRRLATRPPPPWCRRRS